MAGRVTDVLFMNGNSNEGFTAIMNDSKAEARKVGRDERELRFGANGFAIVRDTEEEALETLRDIITNADVEAVKGFGEAVKTLDGHRPKAKACGRIPRSRIWFSITTGSKRV
jgi:FMNH2-dependent dimethyl sulfone monooxygenase